MPERPEPWRRYLDADYRILEIENTLAATDYFGDAIPTFSRGINTGYLGLFAGAVPRFDAGTVWIEPCVASWPDAPRPRFDPELPIFRRILEVSDALRANARGRYRLAFPDHLDAVTTLSQMRGVEALMFDLVDDPEPAAAFRDDLVAVWKRSFDFWVARDRAAGLAGVTNWARAYSPTRGGVVQCDFSAMLSPDLFRGFVRPELAAEAAHLDGALFHLDGPGQIPHVETILAIPGMTAIQWTPGAGRARPAGWPDLMRRLQAAGKALQVYCQMEDLDALFEMLRPEGVMFVFLENLPADAAREALRRIERWSART
jgi:5-methyltetrahydrofolate--homocysteine methyltransferase